MFLPLLILVVFVMCFGLVWFPTTCFVDSLAPPSCHSPDLVSVLTLPVIIKSNCSLPCLKVIFGLSLVCFFYSCFFSCNSSSLVSCSLLFSSDFWFSFFLFFFHHGHINLACHGLTVCQFCQYRIKQNSHFHPALILASTVFCFCTQC